MARVIAHHWSWHFAQPPAVVWPALADTARFNDAAGLPKHQITERPQPDGTVQYSGEARIGPFAIRRRLPADARRPRLAGRTRITGDNICVKAALSIGS